MPPTGPWRERRPAIRLYHARALGLSGDLRRSWEVLQELRHSGGPGYDEAIAFSAVVARMRGDLEQAAALLSSQGEGAALPPAAQARRHVELAALAVLGLDSVGAVEHGTAARSTSGPGWWSRPSC